MPEGQSGCLCGLVSRDSRRTKIWIHTTRHANKGLFSDISAKLSSTTFSTWYLSTWAIRTQYKKVGRATPTEVLVQAGEKDRQTADLAAAKSAHKPSAAAAS